MPSILAIRYVFRRVLTRFEFHHISLLEISNLSVLWRILFNSFYQLDDYSFCDINHGDFKYCMVTCYLKLILRFSNKK